MCWVLRTAHGLRKNKIKCKKKFKEKDMGGADGRNEQNSKSEARDWGSHEERRREGGWGWDEPIE